ncbi:type I restriction-modification system subunit M [Methylobacterium sp. E-041]|uniref:class I SAM-dependent DNA methyltransferase n=1 Tax=Methylobacterium sp. E-041 TaxID=2836573 RepID=UPI001FB9A7C1|nr:N-6 DNA methylase [Methylobacterium sp. E-041]MCJ2109030.1 type I restriction-modification system subunit M [Methylobacterium sp. E-041]
MGNQDIVQKLWGLCNVLRDDGITYHQYVNELAYLLFLKMAREIEAEEHIPSGYRWIDLFKVPVSEQFDFYRRQLVVLGTSNNETIRTIFANPTSLLRHPESLSTLVAKIDEIDWYSIGREGLGDIYEGLLEKNASEKKSGAGQYFTPRPLIEAIVEVIRPEAKDVIHDPAAGTGGFLVVANEYIKIRSKQSVANPFFVGVELVQDTHRLLLMNAILHGMAGEFLHEDSLSASGAARIPPADIILTNPPFGNKRGGGLPGRRDLAYPTSNKQLAFLQHIILSLKPGGRAAVVVPDSVLYEGNIGKSIRRELIDTCNLHTILRLPDGIFYANVTTCVLFFVKDARGTQNVWLYDMRANLPNFGKRTPLGREHFAEFEAAYGSAPDGSSDRNDQGESGRFRRFSRSYIEQRNFDLAMTWLIEDKHGNSDAVADIDEIANQIREVLHAAFDDFEQLVEQLQTEPQK